MPFNQTQDITRLILNSALDATVCIDMGGRISFWSKQAEALFGWNEQEITGKLLSETIVPEKHRKKHENGMLRYQNSGNGVMLNRLIEIEACDKSGREFYVELTIVPVKENGEEFFCGFLRDISERKNAEAELRKEKELADFVFDSLPGIFYVQDEDGNYLRWNKNFELATGYSAGEIRKMHPRDFFSESEWGRVNEAVEKVFREGKAEIVADAITKDKKIFPFTSGQRRSFTKGKNA